MQPADRHQLLANVRRSLDAEGVPIHLRNPGSTVQAWVNGGGDDLDLWVASRHLDDVLAVMHASGLVPIAGGTSGRPGHFLFASRIDGGLALVEWMSGAIRVGPLVVLDETLTTAADGEFTELATTVDATTRRLALGKPIDHERLAVGRASWGNLTPTDREVFQAAASRILDDSSVRNLVSCLDDDALPPPPPPAWPRRALTRLRGGQSLRSLGANAMNRWIPSRNRVAGRRPRGTLVAMIGTDGTGKTTTGRYLAPALREFGLGADLVYFGRTRGNLPGIGWLRQTIEKTDPTTDASGLRRHPQRYHQLRKVASFYYAAEYALRYWLTVAPRLIAGRTVILDRFVYDLNVMPSGSRSAAALAAGLVRTPDLLLLLEAPADEIHRRKPERDVKSIAHQQGVFRETLGASKARHKAAVSTSDTDGTDLDRVVNATVTIAMRAHLRPDLVEAAMAQIRTDPPGRGDKRAPGGKPASPG